MCCIFLYQFFISPIVAENMTNYIVMEQNDEVKENARIIAEQTEGPTSSEGVSEELQLSIYSLSQ